MYIYIYTYALEYVKFEGLPVVRQKGTSRMHSIRAQTAVFSSGRCSCVLTEFQSMCKVAAHLKGPGILVDDTSP